jgi:hypothetical protein
VQASNGLDPAACFLKSEQCFLGRKIALALHDLSGLKPQEAAYYGQVIGDPMIALLQPNFRELIILCFDWVEQGFH